MKKNSKILKLCVIGAFFVALLFSFQNAHARQTVSVFQGVKAAEAEDDFGEQENERVGAVQIAKSLLPQIQETQTSVSSLPWYVTRAAAITAYLLAFFIIILGEGMTTGWAYKYISPVKAWTSHKYLGIAFGIAVLLHMISLLFDKFVNFGIVDILVPFASNYRPLYLSLGIWGFYLLLLVILSSLMIRVRHGHFWHLLHYLVYPMFAMIFVHGISLGSDTNTFVMQLVYWLTGSIFVFLLLHRWRLHLARVAK